MAHITLYWSYYRFYPTGLFFSNISGHTRDHAPRLLHFHGTCSPFRSIPPTHSRGIPPPSTLPPVLHRGIPLPTTHPPVLHRGIPPNHSHGIPPNQPRGILPAYTKPHPFRGIPPPL